MHTTFYPTIEFIMAEPVTKKARSDDDDNVALVLYGVDDLRMVSWGGLTGSGPRERKREASYKPIPK